MRWLAAAAMSAVLVLGASGAAAAAEDDGTSQSVNGSGVAGPGRLGPLGPISLFELTFDATKSADDTVTGQFSGAGRIKALGLDVRVPFSFAGPIECLQVNGDTASFRYPLTSVKPAVLAPLLRPTSILITVREGQGGAADKIGFVGPSPTALSRGCRPSATPLTFDGSLSLDDGR